MRFCINLINGNKANIMKFQKITNTVRAGIDSDAQYGSVMPPVYLSTNYSFEGLGDKREYDYSRSGNPTRDTLANAIADLEGGDERLKELETELVGIKKKLGRLHHLV